MQPPQPPRGPFPGPAPSGGPFGRSNLPGMGVGGPPLPAPTAAPTRGPGMSALGGGPSGIGGPPGGAAAAMVAEVGRGPTVRFQPQVHYFGRMRTGNLHRLVVRIEPEGATPASASSIAAGTQTMLTIQPIVPGAVVTPTSTELPLRSGGEAIFHVLPLVAGKIPEARVELVVTSRRFTNATLPMKANRGRLTRGMFLLTLLVTGLFAFMPFDSWEPYRRPNRANPKLPPVEFRGDKAVQEALKDHVRHLGLEVSDEAAPQGEAANPALAPASTERKTEGPRPQGSAPAGTAPASTAPKKPEEKASESPAVDSERKPNKQEWNGRDYLAVALYKAEPFTSNTYQMLCAIQRMPLGVVYVFASLLLLTIICWFLQRPARRKVQGAMLEMKA